MAERDGARVAVVEQRLRVRPGVRAGRRVARVADRELAVQAREVLLVEHLRDEAEVAQRGQAAVLGDGDPGRLLAAVLERVQAEVGEPRDVAAGRVDAEDAAHQRPLAALAARGRGAGPPGLWIDWHRVVRSFCDRHVTISPIGSTPTGWEVGSRKRPRRACPEGTLSSSDVSQLGDVGPVERLAGGERDDHAGAVGGVGRGRVDPAPRGRLAQRELEPAVRDVVREREARARSPRRSGRARRPRRAGGRRDRRAASATGSASRRARARRSRRPASAGSAGRRSRCRARRCRRRPGCRAPRRRARCPRSPGRAPTRSRRARGCRS